MGGSETSGVEFEKLRKVFLDDKILKPSRFLSLIEIPSNEEFRLDVKTDKYDLGTIRFRRWTHQECNRLNRLPFYGKLIANEPLTDDEKAIYQSFKMEMIADALWDHRWIDRVKDQEIIDGIFTVISYQSGLDVEFDKQLEEFVSSDFGFTYGQLWFAIFGKTPSEVAKLSETDVRVINVWFGKWLERSKRNG